jgi:serine/threonine-protein kinase
MLRPVAMAGAADRELEPGDTLGPYRLEEVLGEGGMGLVFKARRDGDERPVALKVLKRQLSGDLVFQQRFQHEARAAAEVRDPHLVEILESAEWDGRHCLASAYVGGGSLTDRLAATGPLPLADAVRVVSEVGAGLDALHDAGVMHRDIKPSNVLFDSEGTALLTDFGLAKGRAYTVLTRPGQVMGTLDYLAPELIRGQPATPATDIYALGCVAYECIAGQAPFGDKGAFQVGLAHLEEVPPDPCAGRPELPAAVSTAILAALEKDPERRPASAGEYAALLRAAAEEPAGA